MSDQTERTPTPIECLRELLGHFTSQINGADETCWIVGMRNQVRDDRMSLCRAALAQAEAQPAAEPVAWVSPTGLADLAWAREHPTPIISSAHCWQSRTTSATIPLYAQPAAEPVARYMQIMRTPFSIPFTLLNEQQAQSNHGQSLARLAERGGLGVQEALAIVNRQRWSAYDHMKQVDALTALMSAAHPAPAAEPSRLFDAIAWALGTNGDFQTQGTMQGKYWWRGELAERAGLRWDGEKWVGTAPAPAAEPLREERIQEMAEAAWESVRDNDGDWAVAFYRAVIADHDPRPIPESPDSPTPKGLTP